MKKGFAEMLSELRRERGISQKKAAKDLEISQALLSHYENGVREPKFEFVNKACAYYGVSADYILGRLRQDTISVSCSSPYTMDVINNMSELVSAIDDLDDSVLVAISGYLKSVLDGILLAVEDPMHPVKFDEIARQQMLLAEVYTALRKTDNNSTGEEA